LFFLVFPLKLPDLSTKKINFMSQLISRQKAIEMTTLYQTEKENILDPGFRGRNILATAETFDRADFDKVLSEPGCVSVRIYYGMDDGLKVHAIIVGVDDQGEDILPEMESDDNGSIVEEGTRCPPTCAPASPLNGA
jgi:hypothetical protein